MQFYDLLKCLSDPYKLRILNLLLEGPLCVCHIQELLAESQPKVSRHLISMKEAGWLVSSRRHNWTIYEISPLDHLVKTHCINMLRELRQSEKNLQEDILLRESILEKTALEKKECPVTPDGEVLHASEHCCQR